MQVCRVADHETDRDLPTAISPSEVRPLIPTRRIAPEQLIAAGTLGIVREPDR